MRLQVTGNPMADTRSDSVILEEKFRAGGAPARAIRFSIIIPTYNASEDLLECVTAADKLDGPASEILVIDNADSGVFDRLTLAHDFRYVRLARNFGPSLARNVGARYARGDWFVFLDDDGVPEAQLLRRLQSLLDRRPEVYALRGRVVPKKDSVYNLLQQHYDLGHAEKPFYVNLEGIAAMRRQEFEAVGGWNEEMFGHEGEELSRRLVARYGPAGCIYTPEIVLYHDFCTSLLQLIDKTERHRRREKSNPLPWQAESALLFKEYKAQEAERRKDVAWLGQLTYPKRIRLRLVKRLMAAYHRHVSIRWFFGRLVWLAKRAGIRL